MFPFSPRARFGELQSSQRRAATSRVAVFLPAFASRAVTRSLASQPRHSPRGMFALALVTLGPILLQSTASHPVMADPKDQPNFVIIMADDL